MHRTRQPRSGDTYGPNNGFEPRSSKSTHGSSQGSRGQSRPMSLSEAAAFTPSQSANRRRYHHSTPSANMSPSRYSSSPQQQEPSYDYSTYYESVSPVHQNYASSEEEAYPSFQPQRHEARPEPLRRDEFGGSSRFAPVPDHVRMISPSRRTRSQRQFDDRDRAMPPVARERERERPRERDDRQVRQQPRSVARPARQSEIRGQQPLRQSRPIRPSRNRPINKPSGPPYTFKVCLIQVLESCI